MQQEQGQLQAHYSGISEVSTGRFKNEEDNRENKPGVSGHG